MTTRRSIITKKLRGFFEEQGKFLSMDEYRKLENPPIRLVSIKRAVGSWSRLQNMIGEITPKEAPREIIPPRPIEVTKPVVGTNI